jgi:hypothetical protein
MGAHIDNKRNIADRMSYGQAPLGTGIKKSLLHAEKIALTDRLKPISAASISAHFVLDF